MVTNVPHAARLPLTTPGEQVLPILKPVEKCWQPQDFLPDPESPDFLDAVSGPLAARLEAADAMLPQSTSPQAARAAAVCARKVAKLLPPT